MRLRTLAPAAAILAMAIASGPAFGKAHQQPSDTADQLGQANASALDPTGARNADARALTDDEMGVDGPSYSDLRSSVKGSESGLKSGDMTLPTDSPE